MMLPTGRVIAVLAAMACLATSAASQCNASNEQTVFGSGKRYAWFGSRVAKSGSLAMVTENGEDLVYCYERQAGVWVEVQQLRPSDYVSRNGFGLGMEIEGNTAVLGAPWADVKSRDDAGSAYVFQWVGGQWVEGQKIWASDAAVGAAFGWAISLANGVMAIAARTDDGIATDSGSVYVFRLQGSTWVEEQKLTASDGQVGEEFGSAVATDGSVIAVGVYRDDDFGPYSGSTYLFRYDGTKWVEEQKLTAPGKQSTEYFGAAVDIEQGRLLAGATFAGATSSGAVYYFEFDGTQWTESQMIEMMNGTGAGDVFGASISLSGDRLLVGAPGNTTGGRSGEAVAFHYDGASWQEVQRLFPNLSSGVFTTAQHGADVVVDQEGMLVGAPWESSTDYANGAACFYEWSDLGLAAESRGVLPGDFLLLHTCGGLPGGCRGLFLTDISGVPTLQLLDVDFFDSLGDVTWGRKVPPGLSGYTAGFVAFGFWGLGDLASSNTETVSFL